MHQHQTFGLFFCAVFDGLTPILDGLLQQTNKQILGVRLVKTPTTNALCAQLQVTIVQKV